MGVETVLESEPKEVGRWHNFLDSIDFYTLPLRERVHKSLIKLARQTEFYLVYKKLEKVRPKLGKAMLENLTIHHLETSSDFYKKVMRSYELDKMH